MTEVAAAKSSLRGRLLAARRARDEADLSRARAAVCNLVLERAREWKLVAAYVALHTEPGSTQLLDGLGALGISVLVPVVIEDNDLDWRDVAGGPLLGRDAVADVDAVLVPALAVSPRGHRLGRGGGSYDRALRRVRPGTAVIALLFDDEVLDEVPTQAWDVPLGFAVTPSGWRELDVE